MKKLLILVFIVMLAMASTVQAGNIDIASMSLDEIVSLRNELDAEIAKRIETDSSQIHTGQYVVGQDIKEGSYLLTCIAVVGDENCSVSKFVGYDRTDTRLTVGESTTVVLKEDPENQVILAIYNGTCVATPVSPSWAP